MTTIGITPIQALIVGINKALDSEPTPETDAYYADGHQHYRPDADYARALERRLRRLQADQDHTYRELQKPEVVHVCMLRGIVAKISMMDCAHTHGEQAVTDYRKLLLADSTSSK